MLIGRDQWRGTCDESEDFTRAWQKSGIERLRLRDVRHEGANRLSDAGWQRRETARFSGHLDGLARRRYTNMRPADAVLRYPGSTFTCRYVAARLEDGGGC